MRPELRVERHPQVYPPSEDTFLLLRALHVERGERALEVGAGSGLVALHMATVTPTVATDLNPHAVALCRSAAWAHGLTLEVVRTHLTKGIRGPFQLVAFNPPYLPQEGGGEWIDRAWEAGPLGDDVVLPFLGDVRRVLAPGGRIYLVLSSFNDAALEEARRSFRLRLLEDLKFDFETLAVYELR